ncbi:MAG: ABC-F family ATP-binding cassette domain-containing protein [Bacteroidota bacterium]|jgi:ATP-binding cassette subfamily F protein 3|nr:ABC-F family ATP-binding cassette domain-containing protein [Bacteroidota bacterium]
MISLNAITKEYPGKVLFKDVSLRIGDNERVSIVGSNGTGKSTLMKIITGEMEPDSGEIAQSRNNTVGYLPQDGIAHSGRTLFDEAATAFDDIMAMHDRVDELSAEISRLAAQPAHDEEHLHRLVEELGEIQHVLEHREGYNIQTKVAQVLSGLGFHERDFQRRTEEFSGGWQMRIALAKLLLREPTILLLDEPTNHLDLEALQWLEEYLLGYEHSIVLISHDRRFLDNLVKRTIEISLGKLTEYSGNYSFFVDQKILRMEQQRAAYENQQQHIKQTKQFVDRFRYKATKARQVQSRLKMLEKLEPIELEDEEGGISFDFPEPPQPGRILMELSGIAKSYGALHLFENLDLTIERGDRIAFLGVNGAGKSTLARIIAGIESFQHGTRKPGHNLAIGYYAQNQAEELVPRNTVLQTLDLVATGDVRKRLRTLLGCFMFSGSDVDKMVAVLSGGEKSRLALAKMLLTPSNLLILDEPTNHLDMRSKAVLQDALSRYDGSMVIVSHDRDFLEPLVNKCIDFRDGQLRITLGTVSDYLRKRSEEQEEHRRRDVAGQLVEKKSAVHSDRERKREEAQRRQDRFKRIKPLKNRLDRAEKTIADLEEKKAGVEAALADETTYRDEAKAKVLTQQYRDLTVELDSAFAEWESVQAEIDEFDREPDG